MSLLLLGGDWSDGYGGDGAGGGFTGRLKSPDSLIVLNCTTDSEPYDALVAQGWTDTTDDITQPSSGTTIPQGL